MGTTFWAAAVNGKSRSAAIVRRNRCAGDVAVLEADSLIVVVMDRIPLY
jgi:hypothetical protein